MVDSSIFTQTVAFARRGHTYCSIVTNCSHTTISLNKQALDKSGDVESHFWIFLHHYYSVLCISPLELFLFFGGKNQKKIRWYLYFNTVFKTFIYQSLDIFIRMFCLSNVNEISAKYSLLLCGVIFLFCICICKYLWIFAECQIGKFVCVFCSELDLLVLLFWVWVWIFSTFLKFVNYCYIFTIMLLCIFK